MRKYTWERSNLLIKAILFAILASPVVIRGGQTPSTSFSVKGSVRDASGQSIANATLDLYSGGYKISSTTTTSDGAFEFQNIHQGDYQIRSEVYGFDLDKVNFSMGGEQVAKVDITLRSLNSLPPRGGQADQVVADSRTNQDAVSLTGIRLDKLPTFDQDYVGTASRFIDRGALATSGLTEIVDGVESDRIGVSTTAIQEVRVNADPYSIRFSRPGLGRTEIFTRNGQQEFHGNFNFTFRDSSLNSSPGFFIPRDPEQRRIYEGIFSGPLGKNQNTRFLISFDRRDEEVTELTFPGLLLPTPIGFSPVADQKTRDSVISGSIDHSLSSTNTISVRYTFYDHGASHRIFSFDQSPTDGPIKSSTHSNDIRFTDQISLSPRITNEFRVTLSNTRDSVRDTNTGPRFEVLQDGDPTMLPLNFITGGARIDQSTTEYRVSLAEAVSITSGRHTVRAGFDVPAWSRQAFSDFLNPNTIFFFASPQDFVAKTPETAVVTINDGRRRFNEKAVSVFVLDDFRIRPNLMVSAGLRYDWQNHFNDSNNFGPRASFAYGIGSDRKTVIRGGAGIFYDRIGARFLDTVLGGGNLQEIALSSPGFPDPFSGNPVTLFSLTEITQLDPNARIPKTVNYSLGVERQILKDSTISINYIGFKGTSLLNSNFSVVEQTPGGINDFTEIRTIGSTGKSLSNALEVSFRGNLTRYFNGIVLYRLATARDNTSGFNFVTGSFPGFGDYARSDYDRRHRLEVLGLFKARNYFDLGIGLSAYSGTPFSVFSVPLSGQPLDPAVLERNSQNGPAHLSLDLRLSRDFRLVKSKVEKSPVLTFDIDAYNTFNRRELPVVFNPFTVATILLPAGIPPGRRLQLGAKFRF